MESDPLIDKVAPHYNASKNREYRNRVLASFKTFITFLQTNGLTTHEILKEGDEVPITTVIRKSDLTEEGYAVVHSAYDKWLGYTDKTQDPTDTTILEKALAKIRSSKTQSADS